MDDGIDLERGESDSAALIYPITNDTRSKDTTSVSNSSVSNNSVDRMDYNTFGNNATNEDGYQSILGGKFCCFRVNKKLRERLIFGLAMLSAIFTLGVVCGLIYYANQVNSDYFPPGLAYAVYTAIGFSGVVGPLLSFFLLTVLSFDKRSIMEMSPILSDNSNVACGHGINQGTNIRLCCCGQVMVEFYPIKSSRTLFSTYLLGTIIPGLIIVLQIANS